MEKAQRSLFLLLSVAFFFLLCFRRPVCAFDAGNATDFIRSSCGSTRYPDVCFSSLSGYAGAVQESPAQLAFVAVSVSLNTTRAAVSYLKELARTASVPRPVASPLRDCGSVLRDAVDEMVGSVSQMRRVPKAGGGDVDAFRFAMGNVQTWMSAALTNEETCTDGFVGVPDCAVKQDVCSRAELTKKYTSNALALVNSYVNSVAAPKS